MDTVGGDAYGNGWLMYTFWALYSSFFLFAMILYCQRIDLQPIKNSSPRAALLSAFFGYFIVTNSSLAHFVGPENWPCPFSHWTVWIATSGFFLPFPARALRLVLIFKLNVRKLDFYHSRAKRHVVDNPIRRRTTGSAPSRTADQALAHVAESIGVSRKKKGKSLTVMTEKRLVFFILAVVGVCAVFATFRQILVKENLCSGCIVSESGAFVQSLLFALFIFVSLLSMYFLKDVKDEYNINRELQFVTYVWVIFLVPHLVLNFFMTSCSPITKGYPDCTFDKACVDWTLVAIGHWMMNLTVSLSFCCSIVWSLIRSMELGMSKIREERQEMKFPDLSALLSLEQTLADARCRATFQRFLVQEFSGGCGLATGLTVAVENLLFFTDVEGFKAMWKRHDPPAQLKSQGEKIYWQYIDAEGELEVNVPSTISDKIHKTMEGLKGTVSVLPESVFDEAKDEIFRLMERDSFPRFLQSHVCMELVEEVRLEREKHMRLQEAEMI